MNEAQRSFGIHDNEAQRSFGIHDNEAQRSFGYNNGQQIMENSNDFLGNIAMLTKSLQNFKQSPTKDSSFGDSLSKNEDIHGEFKDSIKELVKIEDMIKEYTELIKELKKKKESLRKVAIKHMVHHDLEVANMETEKGVSNRFNLIKSTTKVSPTTKKRLPEKMAMYFEYEEDMDPTEAKERAEKIVNWIYENAETKVTHSLRRYQKK